MGSESERLEREAEDLRRQLQATIEELRARMTLARAVDQAIDLVRHGPAKEFLRDLAVELRRNPLPLVLIGMGVAWLAVASYRRRGRIRAGTAAAVAKKVSMPDAADEMPHCAGVEAWPPASRGDGVYGTAELGTRADVSMSEEA
jgi:hypothetical protein